MLLRNAEAGLKRRLHKDFPYIEAEVAYILRNEFACTAQDVLYRRLRLGFLIKKQRRRHREAHRRNNNSLF